MRSDFSFNQCLVVLLLVLLHHIGQSGNALVELVDLFLELLQGLQEEGPVEVSGADFFTLHELVADQDP